MMRQDSVHKSNLEGGEGKGRMEILDDMKCDKANEILKAKLRKDGMTDTASVITVYRQLH